jgi:hypothetical protein
MLHNTASLVVDAVDPETRSASAEHASRSGVGASVEDPGRALPLTEAVDH